MKRQKDMVLSHDTKIVQQIFREAQRGDRGITFNVFNTNVGLQNNQSSEPTPVPTSEPKRIEAPGSLEYTRGRFLKMLEEFLVREEGDKLRTLDSMVVSIAYNLNENRKEAAAFLNLSYTTFVAKFNKYGIAKKEELK